MNRRKLVLIFLLIVSSISEISSQTYTIVSTPNPRTGYGGFISDPGKYLIDSELQSLNAELIKIEKSNTVEFAIVILPSIANNVPKNFAVELFNAWGIGKKSKDNGLLLLLVMDQRRWEFETGYGLEGVLSDARLKRIGEEKLVPKLKQKKMAEGFADVIQEVVKRINNESEPVIETPIIKNEPVNETEDSTQESSVFYTIISYIHFLIIIYALLFQAGVYWFKNKNGKKSSLLFSGNIINWKLVSIGLTPIMLYFAFCFFYLPYIHILTILIPVYVFVIILCSFHLFEKFRDISTKNYKDPYDYYKVIDLSFRSAEMVIISLFFPIPSLLFVGWSLYKRRILRFMTRSCSKCNTDMIRLDEQKDDFFLKDGQKIEEKIGSIDYDVWFCEKSKDVKIYAYESLFTSYSKCPSCKYKTYFVQSDTVTVSPTCTSSGSGIRRYACKNCSYTTSSTYTIPARDCSKSSSSGSSSSYSSGSSSSSSSSSFGGGRSGGGGAGGSW